MSKQAALDRLHARFTYKRDRWEEWRILADEGPVQGDCEDFALTLIRELEGGRFWRPLLKRKYRIYFCRIMSDGHAVLYDTAARLYADNVNRRWRSREWLEGRHYHSFERVGLLALLLKLFRGWRRSR